MLILNPLKFTTNSQVMKHLKRELQTWTFQPRLSNALKVNVSLDYKRTNVAEKLDRRYELQVLMKNVSAVVIDEFIADLQFPAIFVPDGYVIGIEQREKAKRSTSFSTRQLRQEKAAPGRYASDSEVHIQGHGRHLQEASSRIFEARYCQGVRE